MSEYITQGMDLGAADDTFFGVVESSRAMGGIGFLTDKLVDRKAYYLQSAVIALSEIKHKEWFQ